jgi:hypothetical protein
MTEQDYYKCLSWSLESYTKVVSNDILTAYSAIHSFDSNLVDLCIGERVILIFAQHLQLDAPIE